MNMLNGDEAMSPAEFAKLMGAYPQPAENPLPAYGGYMDNSPANFAWVNNNAYFGAEDGDLMDNEHLQTQELKDMWFRIFGDSDTNQKIMEAKAKKYHYDVMGIQGPIKLKERLIYEMKGKLVMLESQQLDWDTYGDDIIYEPDTEEELEIRMAEGKKNCGCGQDPCITYGAETFSAIVSDGEIVYSVHYTTPNGDKIKHNEYYLDDYGGSEESIINEIEYETNWFDSAWETATITKGKVGSQEKEVIKTLTYESETFEAPYAGAGSLFGIGQNTGLEGFTTSELTTSSAIHGDFDEASLNYSGHQNFEVRAEDEMTKS